MNTDPAAATIALPADFPVAWDDADDAQLSWLFDPMHWPKPVTPLTGQYIAAFLVGANPFLEQFDLPFRMRSRRINTYQYLARPPLALSPEEAADQARRSEAKVAEELRRLDERWANDYLPEIKGHLAYWDSFDLQAASPGQLLGHLDGASARIRRLSELHHLVQVMSEWATSFFCDLYSDLFSDHGSASPAADATLAACRLLQGFDNMSVKAVRELWQLSRRASAMPPVRQVLQEQDATKAWRELETMPAGRSFLAALRAYLAVYGQRGGEVLELATPTWIEEPTPVIHQLQEYVRQPDRDPEADLRAQAAQRERLVAEARARLKGYARPVVDQFNVLLRAAQAGVILCEDHAYWIDYGMTYRVRRMMLEFGRRLAGAGVLDTIDDVFYLTFEEVRETAEHLGHLDQRQRVAGRRAEMAYFRTIQPPPVLGRQPQDAPQDDAHSRASARFWGGAAPVTSETNLLRGAAGSPGQARGPARIVRTLAEASKLRSGDVLVAPTTAPAWSPLFAIVVAVVTDTGGILSHCAIVARECGIPAVVGAGTATQVIHDGQMLEVDGSAGTVRVLPPGTA